jgi:hypothetical protein
MASFRLNVPAAGVCGSTPNLRNLASFRRSTALQWQPAGRLRFASRFCPVLQSLTREIGFVS